jgi:hypothetical protein
MMHRHHGLADDKADKDDHKIKDIPVPEPHADDLDPLTCGVTDEDCGRIEARRQAIEENQRRRLLRKQLRRAALDRLRPLLPELKKLIREVLAEDLPGALAVLEGRVQ